MGLLDGFLTVVPGARVGHIGLYRDPKTLVAVEYYFKMPGGMSERDAVVLDPMLATGNSAVAAVERLKEARPRSIRFVCLVSCPEGIRNFQAAHPDVPVYTAVDRPRAERPRLHPAGSRRRGRPDLRDEVGQAMADLLVTNATLPDGRTGIDVLVAGGRIVNVSPRINAAAAKTVDAGGCLLTPPFVDAHFHMDATLSYGLPRVNESGTLLEGIALWGELKPLLTQDAIVERALALLRLGGGQGAARDPLARRRLRPAAARGRGAAARQGEGEALPRPAARRVSAGRRAAQPERRRAPEEGARDGRGRRRRHPALRAHDARRHGERAHPVRDRGRAGAARRHALRRDRRPAFAPHRDARDAVAAPGLAGPRQRLAPDVDALDGQLLRVEAHPADRTRRA